MTRSLRGRVVGRLRERQDERAPRLNLPTSEAVEGEAPIFIIGAQRSGTSLLRRILNSHSRIACPPETKYLYPFSQILRDTKSLAGLDSLGYDRQHVAAAVASFGRSFLDEYARAQGKSRWAEKTPNYVDCLPELWELFGVTGARFVLIVRHGLDVAASLSDPNRHYPAIDPYLEEAGGDECVAAGLFWADKTRRIIEFRHLHADSCFEIRYEALTIRPEEALRPLFSFLEEEWEPDVIDYSRFTHHAGFGDPDVKRRRKIEPNSGRYSRWPSETQRAVRRACGPLLEELGYE